jgi:uncharacterized membrane protein SpoIIM required for sporulation
MEVKGMSLPQSNRRLGSFVQKNQSRWTRLEELIHQFRRRSLSKRELDELGFLYRKVAGHLAYAQTYFPQHDVTRRLNELTLKAHNLIYGSVKKRRFPKLIRFFARDFPLLFHERIPFFLIAFSLFAVGALLAFFLTLGDPRHASLFLPLGMAENIDPKAGPSGEWNHSVVSSQIMVNNIQVAFLCFAFGALLGVGTVWMLLYNGMLIGALAALFHRAGESYAFWAHIWPHGVTELTAIFIAGGAGLSLAYSLFVPGELTRGESFKREGKVTIQLMMGVIPLFVFAALIEGFLTPAPWPPWTKYLLALSTLILLFFYFGSAWIRKEATPQENPTRSS